MIKENSQIIIYSYTKVSVDQQQTYKQFPPGSLSVLTGYQQWLMLIMTNKTNMERIKVFFKCETWIKSSRENSSFRCMVCLRGLNNNGDDTQDSLYIACGQQLNILWQVKV